ncbi:MAG: UpxY family transcription antiterminator [Pseudomonadota bacterium]
MEDTERHNRELIPLEGSTPLWYVIYTQCRHEAKAEAALQQKGLEVFLPRVTTLSRRRDRKLLLKLPLFPGYLFVRTNLDSYGYMEILKAPGMVRLLGLKGSPTPVPAETIDSVKAIVDSDQPLYPWPYLKTGSLVRVLDGPLAGVVGVILGRKEKKRRLIVSVELFQRSVAVELDREAVERWS